MSASTTARTGRAPASKGFDEIDAEESTDVVVAFWQRMMKRYGSEEDYNKQIVNAFKFGDEPEILIVVGQVADEPFSPQCWTPACGTSRAQITRG